MDIWLNTSIFQYKNDQCASKEHAKMRYMYHEIDWWSIAAMVVESWMSDSTDWPVTPMNFPFSGEVHWSHHWVNWKEVEDDSIYLTENLKWATIVLFTLGPYSAERLMPSGFIILRLNLSWYQLVVGVAAARPVCPVHNADGIPAFCFHSWSWCSHHHSLPKPFIWNYPLSTKTVGN